MTNPTQTKRLEAERDFLLARLDGRAMFVDSHDWIGLSSDAMLRLALRGLSYPEEYPDCWPMDEGDLGRCEETYNRAPEHLKQTMLPTLERFRRHVADGGIHCRGCDTSGHYHTRHNLCDTCRAEKAASS